MIRFFPSAEPSSFDRLVRQPGRAWLKTHSTGRPRNYWWRIWEDVANAFDDKCAYAAMELSAPGTIDHFISVDENRRLAYEWKNYRYATGWINSSKQTLRAGEVLDPFLVRAGWFEILLPSCQLVRTRRCPRKYRARADTMLTRLHLGHDERVVRYRRKWLEEYERQKITFERLMQAAPLVALAVKKREQRRARLHPRAPRAV